MLKKIIATVALGGSLAIGGATAASASPPTSSSTHFNCANASKVLSRINKLESKEQTFVTKATAREATATKAGHSKVAKVIERRITVAQKKEARATELTQKIATACPSSPAPSSSTS